MSAASSAKYVADALRKAIEVAGTRPKVMHSDRVSQYISNEYKETAGKIQSVYSIS